MVAAIFMEKNFTVVYKSSFIYRNLLKKKITAIIETPTNLLKKAYKRVLWTVPSSSMHVIQSSTPVGSQVSCFPNKNFN